MTFGTIPFGVLPPSEFDFVEADGWTGDTPAYEVWSGFPWSGGKIIESHAEIATGQSEGTTAGPPKIAFDLDQLSETLTFSYPRDANAAYATKEGRLLIRRVKRKDIQGTNRTSYWIVAKKVPRADGWVTVSCNSIAHILADYIVEEVVTETGFQNGDIALNDATPTEHVQGALITTEEHVGALPSFFSLGIMDATDRLSFGQSGVTAGEWCTAFAKAIGSEFRVEVADDETGLVLNFPTEIGSGADKVWVEEGKNLADYEITKDYLASATHVRGIDGDERMLWYNAWKIGTIQSGGVWGDVQDSGTVTVADAQQIHRYAQGLSVANLPALIQRGDVNGDGKIDEQDAAAILEYVLGGSGAVTDPTAAARIGAACDQTLLPLIDPLGRSIEAVPVRAVLNGCYLAKDQATYDDEQIVRSHEPNYALVEDDTGFAEGDTVVVRAGTGAAGERLAMLVNQDPLDDGIMRRLARVPRSNITATRNLVDNGFFREYADPDDAPDGFTFTDIEGNGATIERVDDPDIAMYGGYAARMLFNSLGGFTPVHFSLVSPLIYPWELGPDGLACVRFRIIIDALTVSSLTPDDPHLFFQIVSDDELTVLVNIALTATGTFESSIKGLDPSSLTDGYRIRILYNDPGANALTSADITVDVLQVTPGGEDPQVFVEGPEANLLYKVAGTTLIAMTPSVTSYVLKLRDFSRAEIEGFLEDEITIGGKVGLEIQTEGESEVIRVNRYELNEEDPLDSDIHVSSRKQRLVDMLARQAQASLQLGVGALAQALAREIRKTPFSTSRAVITAPVLDSAGADTGSTISIPEASIGGTVSDAIAKAGKRLRTPTAA